jgi:hypothetical protein
MCWRYIFSAALFSSAYISDIDTGFFFNYLKRFKYYNVAPEKETQIRELAKSVGMVNSDRLTIWYGPAAAAGGTDAPNGYPVIFINKFETFKEFEMLHEIGHIINGDAPTKLFGARNDKSYLIRCLFCLAVIGNSASLLFAVPGTILGILALFLCCLIFNASIAYIFSKIRQPRYFRAEENADDFAIKHCSIEGLRTGLESFSNRSVIDTPSHPNTQSRYAKVCSALNKREDRCIYVERCNNKVYYGYDTPELKLFETKQVFMKYSGFIIDHTKEKYNVSGVASFPVYYTIPNAHIISDYQLIQALVNYPRFLQHALLYKNAPENIKQHQSYVCSYSHDNNDFHLFHELI